MARTNSVAGANVTAEPANLDASQIESVLRTALDAVREGARRLSELVSSVRAEYDRTRAALEKVKAETLRCIEEVDALEAKSRVTRYDLFRVSRDFQRYTELDVRRAYEEAERVQILLGEVRERERSLRERRAELERSLARLSDLLEHAETVEANMKAALDALSGNYSSVTRQISDWQARYEIGRRIITAQEEERRLVARDLHDGAAQGLAGISVELELSERMLDAGPDAIRHQLQRLRTVVKETLSDLRRVIFELRPMALDDLGVVAAVRRYADSASTVSNIPCEVIIHGEERRYDRAIEVAAFRLVQEAVHNAVRHAAPSHVWVTLEAGSGYLHVTVRDDGRGFDPDAARREAKARGSLGLLSMQERVELFGGRFTIHSTPGTGTRVSARFPVVDQQQPAQTT